MKTGYRMVVGLVMTAVMCGVVAPVQAIEKDFLMNRKFHGVVVLGLGGLLIKSAIDAKRDANDAYDFYKAAGTTQVAQAFYDDSKRDDTRAAVFAVLGTGAILYSVHLFLKDDNTDLPSPKLDRGIVNVKGVGLDVGADLVRGNMQVRLKKGF